VLVAAAQRLDTTLGVPFQPHELATEIGRDRHDVTAATIARGL
jgi:hypothetical protein